MARAANPVALLAAWLAVLILGLAAPVVCAAVGDVLFSYKSQLGTLPSWQGWTLEGLCYNETCPGIHYDPDPMNFACYYQGWRDMNTDLQSDNSCLPGIGCRKTGPSGEYYNAPEPLVPDGTCTYTEWMAFDDGNNRLTIPDSMVSGSPPFGAPMFINAPTWPTLRIVTGDGNLSPGSLPVQNGPPNSRNSGKIEVHQSFTVPGGATAITLTCRVAAGPRLGGQEFVRVRVFGRRFAFGVDGDSQSANFGRLTYGNDGNGNPLGLMFSQPVLVALATASAQKEGEFFLLRAILNIDGTFTAYLNEDTYVVATGQAVTDLPGGEIVLTPGVTDATMWFDYVEMREGAVPVDCPHPGFDFNRDKRVDDADIGAFYGCATGPANANGSWASLSFECRCMDVTADQSIDMNDFAILQRCLTVGGTLSDPICEQ